MNPTDLTDDQLVAATNEYIQRTVRRARNQGLAQGMTIMLYASIDGDKYQLSHDLHYGRYSNEIKLTGGNLFELVEKHCAIAGISVTPPLQVTPTLSAPEIEEAHFVPVENDDVPF